MKTNIKTLITTIIFCMLLSGCPPKVDPPVTPELSQSAITLEEGKTAEVTIKNGIPPYKATVSPSAAATATVSGTK